MRILVLTLMMSFLSHSAFGAAECEGGSKRTRAGERQLAACGHKLLRKLWGAVAAEGRGSFGGC